jgi:hypothetical protein
MTVHPAVDASLSRRCGGSLNAPDSQNIAISKAASAGLNSIDEMFFEAVAHFAMK